MARELDLPISTVQSILQNMLDEGFLWQDVYDTYHLGPVLVEIGMAAFARLDLRQIALPYLRELSEYAGAACTLNLWNGDDVICVDVVVAVDGVPWTAKVGKSYPLQVGAIGKSILAFLPSHQADSAIAHLNLSADLRRRFDQQMAQIRALGVALSIGEKRAGGLAVAAPIWNWAGQVHATMAVVGPAEHFDDDRQLVSLTGRLRQAANAVSIKQGAQEAWLGGYGREAYAAGSAHDAELLELVMGYRTGRGPLSAAMNR
jgi:DNA-binding IclR family transcriptional regulator